MNRAYNNGTFNDIKFFIGTEVEKTPAFNMKTLFVVGLQLINDIMYNATASNCSHVYLGANQSFNMPLDADTYNIVGNWSKMVTDCLSHNFLVTLDFDIKYLDLIINSKFMNDANFIPQISIKIPHIRKLNYNTTIKIDDTDFKSTNPGVWCHKLNELLSSDKFTAWHEYTKDEPL